MANFLGRCGSSLALALSIVSLQPTMAAASIVTFTDVFTVSTTTDMGTAPVFRRSFGPDWLRAEFTASGGSAEMDVLARASVTASYENKLSLSDSRATQILLKSPLLFSGHRASFIYGAKIDVRLLDFINESESAIADLSSVSLPFPRRSDFGETVSAVSGSEQIIGLEKGVPGAAVSIGWNSFIETSHRVTDFSGTLKAKHATSGAVRQAFVSSLFDDRLIDLDLGLDGEWALSFTDGQIKGSGAIDPYNGFGLAGELKIGIGCGDPGTDEDNGRFCVEDNAYALPPALPISPYGFSSTFSMNQSGRISLGEINDAADPEIAPVPLPGSGALLLTVLGAGLLSGRRKTG